MKNRKRTQQKTTKRYKKYTGDEKNETPAEFKQIIEEHAKLISKKRRV